MSTLPVLPCPHCGTVAVPHLTPGTGPHTTRADCARCGRFLKWLPKRLLQSPVKAKETKPPRDVNHVILVGAIGPSGVEVTNSHTGVPCASFTLEVQERGEDGQAHSKLIPCEVWGVKAESAVELEAGEMVRIEGNLRKWQKGELWDLVVSGFEVTPVVA